MPSKSEDVPSKAQFLEHANQMRADKKRPLFQYDSRLEQAAQDHADRLAAGRERPHARLQKRIDASGFPQDPKCLISRRSMQASYTEGVAWASYDVDLTFLDNLVSAGPGEGHYDDFFDPLINRVGFGTAGKWLVVDYGRDCSATPPAPLPKPKVLTEEDFAAF